MKILFVMLATILSLSQAEAASVFPQQFSLSCGDLVIINPQGSILSPSTISPNAFIGSAVKMPDTQVTGYYQGGIGYTVTGQILDSEITGQSNPVDVTFTCYSRNQSADDALVCGAISPRSSTAIPNFGGFNARLSLPNFLCSNSSSMGGSGTVSVTREITMQSVNSISTRRYHTTREVACNYQL